MDPWIAGRQYRLRRNEELYKDNERLVKSTRKRRLEFYGHVYCIDVGNGKRLAKQMYSQYSTTGQESQLGGSRRYKRASKWLIWICHIFWIVLFYTQIRSQQLQGLPCRNWTQQRMGRGRRYPELYQLFNVVPVGRKLFFINF